MASNPSSILFISSRGDAGAGGENYLMTVLRHLDRDRFRPIVVLPKAGNLVPQLEALSVKVRIVEAEHGWLKQPGPWYQLLGSIAKNVRLLVDIINDYKIDIVHTNSNHRLEGALAAQLAGVRHLYLAHIEFQPEMPVFRRFELNPASYARVMAELSDHVVAVSESVANTLRGNAGSTGVEVIHNGIELDSFDQAAAGGGHDIRTEMGLSGDALLVTAVGRLNPDKGFDTYLEAAAGIAAQTANAHFLIVGGAEVDSFARTLADRVEELDIGDRFHFLGFRKDVPSVLAQSDIFVLSSRREGHPYVLLEAMAARCAVVATNCAGVEETLANGKTGFVVDIEDHEGMGQAILDLALDSGKRASMAAAGRQHIVDCFQAQTGVEALMGVYDAMLERAPAAPGSPAIEFFLSATHEVGALGLEVQELDERLKKVESLNTLLLQNPIVRLGRRLRGLLQHPIKQRLPG